MKDLMQKVMSFMTFDFPIHATNISSNFAETHQKLQLEAPEWSTTATRQQLISNYWFIHATRHFAFLFGIPALVFFFVSGGFHDLSGYLVTLITAGTLSYSVLYLFFYHPTFCTTFLPRLETVKEVYDQKRFEQQEKCRQAQLSNFALTLVFYVFEKSIGMDSLLCNDKSAGLLTKLYGVDPGSLKKNLELIYGKKKCFLPRKETEIANRFDEAIGFFEEIGFLKGISILEELQKKIIQF